MVVHVFLGHCWRRLVGLPGLGLELRLRLRGGVCVLVRVLC
jgi:hypothetical protein